MNHLIVDHWEGEVDFKGFSVPISEAKILRMVGKKYPASVFDKYWNEHRNSHYESGRNKCGAGATERWIKFEIMDVSGNSIKLLGMIYNFPGRRGQMCYVPIKKYTITFDDEDVSESE